jgi:uncharacterized membrane protein YvlD (DUF360 family)
MMIAWLLQWISYGLGLWLLQLVSPAVSVSALVGYVFFATGLWLLERLILPLLHTLTFAIDWLTLGVLSRLVKSVVRLVGLCLLLMFVPEVHLATRDLWSCWQAIAGLWVYCAVMSVLLR